MRNPWLDLPTNPPFVLPSDKLSIDAWNERMARKTDKPPTYIQLWWGPEPYLGRPDAPIVLLNLNPGAPKLPDGWRDKTMSELAWHDPALRWRANLMHTVMDYPFYLLFCIQSIEMRGDIAGGQRSYVT